MKLCFLIDSLFRPAGTERIATDIANGLNATTSCKITFLVLSDNISTYYPLDKNLVVKSISKERTSFWTTISCLHRYLKDEKPDYIINVTTTMSRISILAAIGTMTKVITWEHFNLYAGTWLGRVWRLCSACFSSRTVVLTYRDKNNYPYFLQKKIVTIYNFPTPVKEKLSELTSNIAISVGRLTYQKGFDMLLDVWSRVLEVDKTWLLYIIGSGEDELLLKQQAATLGIAGSVYFIPANSHIADYYQMASLYIMPSRFEGFGLVLVEARQQKLPCVSFDCPNGPDEIIRQGIDGELVPMGDIKAMVDSILSFINNRAKIQSYGKAALEDVKQRFAKKKILKDWIELFSEK